MFLPRACPMAAAPADRILLSQRFRVVKLHRPFNSLPTALAPLSLILLCERSEKRSNELWLKLKEGSLIGFSESRVCVIWRPGLGIYSKTSPTSLDLQHLRVWQKTPSSRPESHPRFCFSLHSKCSKGKGKGILGMREARGALPHACARSVPFLSLSNASRVNALI